MSTPKVRLRRVRLSLAASDLARVRVHTNLDTAMDVDLRSAVLYGFASFTEVHTDSKKKIEHG